MILSAALAGEPFSPGAKTLKRKAWAAKSLTMNRQTLRLPRRSTRMVGSTERKVQDVTHRDRPVRPFVRWELRGDAER